MVRYLNLLFVLLIANVVFALTEGPAQPEFISFEPVDATDMVNMATGDMSYVLPVGNVKTPEGVGYPITLSYHAGITNEQEATWVGLGWSLNVGSINRSVLGYPDDHAGEFFTNRVHSTGDRGIDITITPTYENGGTAQSSFCFRYTASTKSVFFLGYQGSDFTTPNGFGWHAPGMMRGRGQGATFSISQSFGGYELGYNFDNTPGMYESISMSKGAVGFSLSSEGDVSVSAGGGNERFAFSVGFSAQMTSSQGYNSQSFTISGSGSYNIGEYGGKVGLKIAPTFWKWTFDQVTYGRAWGFLYQSPQTAYTFETDNEILNAYMPKQSAPFYQRPQDGVPLELPDDFEPQGLYVKQISDKLEYINIDERFNFSSADMYSIAAQGLGGTFKPFVSSPMTTCYSHNPEIDGLIGIPKQEAPSEIGTYFNFNGTSGSTLKSAKVTDNFRENNSIVFKLLGENSYNLIDRLDGVTYSSSPQLYAANEYSDIDNTDNIVSGTKIVPLIGLDPDFKKKLCGFVITDRQGKSYYFTEPLFSLQKASYTNENKEFPINMEKSNINFSEDLGPHALTWLLTAITGPDYIKRGNPLCEVSAIPAAEEILPHSGDWGFWVRFRYEYGDYIDEKKGLPVISYEEDAPKGIKKGTYSWRTPYYDRFSSDDKKFHDINPCLKDYKNPMKKAKYTSAFGRKEITYLKSIETASEIAFFRTSERLDGFGIEYNSKEVYDYPHLGKVTPCDNPFGSINISNHNIKENWNGLLPPYNHKRVTRFPSVVPLYSDVKAAGVDEIDLSKCLKFEVAGNDNTWWDNTPEGAEMIHIDVTAKKEFHRIAPHPIPFYYWNISEKGKGGKITVVKDVNGWKYNSTTNRMVRDPSVELDYAKGSTLGSVKGRIDVEIPLLPINGLKIDFGSQFTQYARCVHASFDEDTKLWTFYVLGYEGKIKKGKREHDLVTGSMFGPEYLISRKTTLYELSNITDIKYIASYFTDGTWKRYENRNPTVRYVKKLDEIAWYSKSKYPYLTGESDPYINDLSELGDAVTSYGYPQSYRRVKFRYNYELAKGTPNSKSDGVKLDVNGNVVPGSYSGGRLTLKEVREEAGPEDAPVVMPPYLFDYQGKDKKYSFGYQSLDDPSTASEDEWGFPKEPTEDMSADNAGIYWNLSSILLPSCGKLSFEYKRDYINSVYGTLCQMKRDQYCVCSKNVYEHSYYNGDYYISKWVTSPRSNLKGVSTLTLDNTTQLEVGMFAILFFAEIGVDVQTNYTYRINSISGNTVTLNQPIGDEARDYDAIYLKVLKNTRVNCGDLRVTMLTSRDLNGNTIKTRYNYPQGGVVKALPARARPDLFFKKEKIFEAEDIKTRIGNDKTDFLVDASKKCDKAGFSGSGYVRMEGKLRANVKFNDLSLEETGEYYLMIRYSCDADAKREIKLSQDLIYDKDISFPNTSGLWDTAFQEIEVRDKWYDEYEDPVISITIDNKACSECDKDIDIDWIGLRWVPQATVIDSRPIEFGLYHDYMFGNASSVMYPVVETFATEDGINPISGKARFHYYTFEDKVDIDGHNTLRPIIEERFGTTTTGVNVVQYVDRSGIVGKEKLIEKVNNNGDVIFWSRPNYCYADKLNDEAGVTNSLNSTLPSSRPLGLVRERMKRMETSIDLDLGYDADKFRLAGITDVITSPIYNIGARECTDGLVKESRSYLYDALGGNPLISLTTNVKSDGNTEQLITGSVPRMYFLNSTEKQKCLKKNVLAQEGITFIAKANATIATPPTLNTIFSEHSKTAGDYKILQSSAVGWKKKTVATHDGVPEQEYYYKDTSYVWNGSPDYSPVVRSKPAWTVESRTLSIDNFARPLNASDALGTVFSVIQHPYFSTISAKIDNAGVEECGILTADYDELVALVSSNSADADEWVDDGVYDSKHSWNTGGSKLSTAKVLFGQKSIYVKGLSTGNIGPNRDIAGIDKNKEYTFSVWVYPVALSSTAPIALCVDLVDQAGNTTPILQTEEANSTVDLNKWSLISRKISPAALSAFSSGKHLKISVGSRTATGPALAEFYVQDIRFHPSDALVTTFYYDQNSGNPIAFVDANNNASYYRFDEFGRLIEKGRVVRD
jgi:hypothetical protein